MDEADDYIERVKTSDEANTERTRSAACRVTFPSDVFPLALSAAGAALAVEAAEVDEAEAAEMLAEEAAALTDVQVWLEGIDRPVTRMTSEHLRERVKEKEDQQSWNSWKGKKCDLTWKRSPSPPSYLVWMVACGEELVGVSTRGGCGR